MRVLPSLTTNSIRAEAVLSLPIGTFAHNCTGPRIGHKQTEVENKAKKRSSVHEKKTTLRLDALYEV